MNKKIGISTIHHNTNPGAILQAYSQAEALQNYFKESEVEIIDYRIKNQEFKAMKSIFLNLARFKFEVFEEKLLFKDFIEKNLPLSDKTLLSDSYEKAIEFIRGRYDIIFVGSDELWKTVSDKFTRPFPNIYWLAPEINAKKIAFAVSANRCEIGDINQKNRKKAKKLLEEFDFIGVRDEHSSKLIKKLGVDNKDIYKIPDPTFTYDFKKNHSDMLKNKLENLNINFNKPILGWNINVIKNEKKYNIQKKIYNSYKEKGYQIVSLRGDNQFSDANLQGELNPFEWAQVFRYFDFCINQTFHGTIFSLKNKTPFLSIEYQDYYSRIKGKIHDLLDDLSMLDNYLYLSGGDQNVSKILNNAEQSFEKGNIDRKIRMMRNKYHNGLNKVEKII